MSCIKFCLYVFHVGRLVGQLGSNMSGHVPNTITFNLQKEPRHFFKANEEFSLTLYFDESDFDKSQAGIVITDLIGLVPQAWEWLRCHQVIVKMGCGSSVVVVRQIEQGLGPCLEMKTLGILKVILVMRLMEHLLNMWC